jgi:hypothetical protein
MFGFLVDAWSFEIESYSLNRGDSVRNRESSRLFFEGVVLGHQAFKFDFVDAGDKALGFVDVAGGFGQAERRADGEHQAHAQVGADPGTGGRKGDADGGGGNRQDKRDPDLDDPGAALGGGVDTISVVFWGSHGDILGDNWGKTLGALRLH